jgi:hypothetical protein
MVSLCPFRAGRHRIVAACFALMAVAAPAATSVTQFGITWTFDRDYPTGQFANGDYWVVGPVTLTGITPRSTTVDGVTMHGSVINPVPSTTQGFDSRIKNNAYDATRNVARAFPLTVPAGSSILSAESHLALAAGNDAQLKTIAVLTVVATAPAPGSFRPPYAGTDKTIRWNKNQLDYSKLRSLPIVASTPALSSVEALFEKPFVDLRSSWAGTYLQPSSNHPSYGREISHQVGSGLLSLQLDYTHAQKETLLVRLVQRGLDVYGLAAVGGNWHNDGGHRHGRKPMLLLAGTVLNDPAILAYADAQKAFLFQEDHQTFYVSMEDVLRPRKTSDGRYREPYTAAMIGTPEWGGKHKGEPEGDAAQWDAPYRTVCGASTVGTVLAARLMGLESTWNWPVLFDYIDRYWRVEGHLTTTGTNAIQPFVKSMWNAYRLSTPPPLGVITPAKTVAPSTTVPTNLPSTVAPASRLANISTRSRTGPGEDVMIAGFAIRGSSPQSVLIRAVGPSLAGYGVTGALAHTRLVIYRGQTKIAESQTPTGPGVATASQRVGAFALPNGSQDAALFVTLEPGNYSAHVTSPSGATGVVLVEVYEAAEGALTPTSPRLINLSSRGRVETGDAIMIAGIVVTGDAPKRLLLRAVGPGLAPFGVGGVLNDPLLRLYQGDRMVAENDDWAGAVEVTAAAATVGAFALAGTSQDAALLVTLEPGSYSAHVSGRHGSTGLALVEVYELP